MTLKTVGKILLALAVLIQAAIAVSAEGAGNWDRASYELLWMFFFAWLLKMQGGRDV